jgi:hypothetical protein
MALEHERPDPHQLLNGPQGCSHGSGNGNAPGELLLLGANEKLSPVQSAHHRGSVGGSTLVHHSSAPAPTLVGAAGGLQIKLIWDSSVASAPSNFMSAAIKAAQLYTTEFSNPEVINIQVGYGEVAGQRLPSGALTASESYGYSESYSQVASALKQDASSSTWQGIADASLPSSDPTHGGSFFVTTAEAKALGQVNGYGSSVDGYVGLSSQYPMNYAQSGISGNQFDAVGALEHEISEVMGRMGSEGALFGSNVYTPLDLFRYSGPGVRDLAPGPGYFSVNGGATNLGAYNNPNFGGDASDWTPSLVGDSYGDGYPGVPAAVSPTDLIEDSTLGYRMTPMAVSQTQKPGLA